ncbi:MAG: hypothetical protein MZV70_73335 [Desulfobacterales bacterium]|nr:hypothetical protein [Desulfobacterales bacterium]
MFRYERPQKGRYRQFHQINAERLGEDGPLADAETLAMAYDLASSILGRDVLLMEVNSLGCKAVQASLQGGAAGFPGFQAGQPLCSDCRRRMHTNPLRVLDCKVPEPARRLYGAPRSSRTTSAKAAGIITQGPGRAGCPWREAMRRTPGWSAGSTTTPGPPSRSRPRAWAPRTPLPAAADTTTC